MGNARRRLQKHGKSRIPSRQSITYIEPKEASCDMEGAFETLRTLFGVVGLSRAKACGLGGLGPTKLPQNLK